MSKRLQMVFKNSSNSNVTLSVENPRDNITALEVKTAMDGIVAKNVFQSKTGKVISSSTAKIITTETQELEI